VFVITSGGPGTVAPSSVELSGDTLTFGFAPPVCAGSSGNDGERSFFFGLASPFAPQDVDAEIVDSLGAHVTLDARAPDFVGGVVLQVAPGAGVIGTSVRLIGSGYTPGGYPGTLFWNGASVGTFDIPAGGAFSIPYTIPHAPHPGPNLIAACSGSPCTTGEFEQQDSVAFDVEGFFAFLPLTVR
jgi:hypothetical protein